MSFSIERLNPIQISLSNLANMAFVPGGNGSLLEDGIEIDLNAILIEAYTNLDLTNAEEIALQLSDSDLSDIAKELLVGNLSIEEFKSFKFLRMYRFGKIFREYFVYHMLMLITCDENISNQFWTEGFNPSWYFDVDINSKIFTLTLNWIWLLASEEVQFYRFSTSSLIKDSDVVVSNVNIHYEGLSPVLTHSIGGSTNRFYGYDVSSPKYIKLGEFSHSFGYCYKNGSTFDIRVKLYPNTITSSPLPLCFKTLNLTNPVILQIDEESTNSERITALNNHYSTTRTRWLILNTVVFYDDVELYPCYNPAISQAWGTYTITKFNHTDYLLDTIEYNFRTADTVKDFLKLIFTDYSLFNVSKFSLQVGVN